MASPVYQSTGGATPGGVDNVVITAPSGIADGDILIAQLYAEPGSQVITPAAGFTSFVRKSSGAAEDFVEEWFWKRAKGESGNYTFVETGNTWGNGQMFRFSGCIDNSSPYDAYGSGDTSVGANPTLTGITTLSPDTLLCWCLANFDGGAGTAPSGMTERVDNTGQYLATLDLATVGATGNKQGTFASDTWVGVMFALRSQLPSPSSGSLMWVTG